MAKVMVVSDFWLEIEDMLWHFLRLRRPDEVERVAAQIMATLGAGMVVFLQNNCGDTISGGPITAEKVMERIPFDRLAHDLNKAEDEFRDHLIVFSRYPDNQLLHFDLNEVDQCDFELPPALLPPDHPLSQMRAMAKGKRQPPLPVAQ